jgi:hypothetical protein
MSDAARAESERFQHQMAIERICEVALGAIDKPGEFMGDPEATLARIAERKRNDVEEALVRCQRLVEDNPRDFVAAGAVQILTNVLAAS